MMRLQSLSIFNLGGLIPQISKATKIFRKYVYGHRLSIVYVGTLDEPTTDTN